MKRIDICRQIASEMDRYEIDGYWYGRHDSVITKVTTKNVSGDAIEDLAQEILRVAAHRTSFINIYGEKEDYGYDWKYRGAIKKKIQELKA